MARWVVSKRTPTRSASRPLRDEADIGLVVKVVSAIKDFRALVRRRQQGAQARHRPVVQVGGPQPHAVEVHRNVAGWLYNDILTQQFAYTDQHG